MSALVLALTGTDHHPFDRLVGWVDAAAARHHGVRFVVQHGVTRPPLAAEGVDFLGHGRLVELLAEASVVVCHGGPGTITEARDAGHVPLCVPRDPRLGEHVDDHQQRFASLVAGAGAVRLVRSQQTFDTELAAALLLAPGAGPTEPPSRVRDAARALAAAELELVMTVARPHALGRRRVHD